MARVEAGQVIARRSGDQGDLTVGANAILGSDGVTVTASLAGCAHIEERRAWVEPLLEIPGDATVPIDFAGDVIVAGAVPEGGAIKASGSIWIGHIVEGGHVTAGRDLHVEGGIVGRERTRCVVGRNLSTRYIRGAWVEVQGNIVAVTEIVGSEVRCRGQVLVTYGPITGGVVTAAGGVVCAALGSSGGTPTVVEPGVDYVLQQCCRELLPKIEQCLSDARKIQTTVKPLLENKRGLTAALKEKATELLYASTELETNAAAMTKTLEKTYRAAAARVKAQVEVSGALQPGVTLRFVGVEAQVGSVLQGPLRVVREASGSSLQVVLEDLTSQATAHLKARSFGGNSLGVLEHLLSASAKPCRS
jgi:uncharacterized protein (DUF342 family)